MQFVCVNMRDRQRRRWSVVVASATQIEDVCLMLIVHLFTSKRVSPNRRSTHIIRVAFPRASICSRRGRKTDLVELKLTAAFLLLSLLPLLLFVSSTKIGSTAAAWHHLLNSMVFALPITSGSINHDRDSRWSQLTPKQDGDDSVWINFTFLRLQPNNEIEKNSNRKYYCTPVFGDIDVFFPAGRHRWRECNQPSGIKHRSMRSAVI